MCLRRGPHLPSQVSCHCPQSSRCGEIDSDVFGSALLFAAFGLGDPEGMRDLLDLRFTVYNVGNGQTSLPSRKQLRVCSADLPTAKGHVSEGWPTVSICPGLKDFLECGISTAQPKKELGQLGPLINWSLCVSSNKAQTQCDKNKDYGQQGGEMNFVNECTDYWLTP